MKYNLHIGLLFYLVGTLAVAAPGVQCPGASDPQSCYVSCDATGCAPQCDYDHETWQFDQYTYPKRSQGLFSFAKTVIITQVGDQEFGACIYQREYKYDESGKPVRIEPGEEAFVLVYTSQYSVKGHGPWRSASEPYGDYTAFETCRGADCTLFPSHSN